MNATVESIWNEVASQLRSFIRSRVRNHATADDILQDVFLKIHQKLPSVRASERLEAWVWRITRNAIADHFRKLGGTPSYSLPMVIPQHFCNTQSPSTGLQKYGARQSECARTLTMSPFSYMS